MFTYSLPYFSIDLHIHLTAYAPFREVVRLGEWDLSTEIDCETIQKGDKFCAPEPPQDFQHEEIIKHSQFNKRGEISDDIALIRLARPITFSRKYGTVFIG